MKKTFMGVVLIVACIAGIVLLIQNDNKQVVVFGSSIRQIVDKWGYVTDYTERESFTYSLMQDSANQDYTMAEITVGENRAEFHWTFEEERDRLVECYVSVKNDSIASSGKEPFDKWLFLKVKTDDIYDLDIWNKVQETWGSDLEEKHTILACVNETGSICQMGEYDDGLWIGKWGVYIKEDFLYVLECVDNQLSSDEDTKMPVGYFYLGGILDDTSDYCVWGIDDEDFYWRDHDERVIRLENPSRVYTQVPGTDDRWSHYPGKEPCGIVQTAEYIVSLSEDSPKLQIRFTLEGDAMELELPDIGPADYPYTMEVSDAASGKLLQETEACLCVDAIDTLRFEDMDGDGCLDMHIVYPDHCIVAESQIEDQFAHPYYYYDPPQYWIWDSGNNVFVCMRERELSDYVQKRRLEQQEKDFAEEEKMIKEKTIIVQKGDSLWSIAQKYLGDGARYMELYHKNKDVIGINPDLILPGMQIELTGIGKN